MNAQRLRRAALAAASGAAIVSLGLPAPAQAWWRGGYGWRGGCWRCGYGYGPRWGGYGWRGGYGFGFGPFLAPPIYAPPPVIYAPPPPAYYAPPIVAYPSYGW